MKPFSAREISALDTTKYLYIRAGAEHRFIPIWVVVVDGKVLVRPWNNRKRGWFNTFLIERNGAIKIGAKEVPVRTQRVRGQKLNDAMDRGYAVKYTTKANVKYVKGFATSKRRANTLALVRWDV
ncbi:MAG: DUF2255 family protein [Gemmatimonadaceae bacterium]